MSISLKSLCPVKEFAYTVTTEFLQALGCLHHRANMIGIGLGIELVGIANNLLLQGLRLPPWQPCTCVTLCDTGMTGEALLTQQLTANLPMTDIRFRTITTDGGCVAAEHTDIMKHRCLLYELAVDRQFPVAVTDN